jgi:hypothetical protein
MSRTESRRPLRVLSAKEIARLQQQQNQAPRNAAQLAAMQSADRFRRTLAGPPRRAETAVRSSSAQPKPERQAEASARLPQPDRAEQVLHVDTCPAEPAGAAAPAGSGLVAPEEREGEGPAALPAEGLATPDLAQDPWPEQMAQTIANLCARAAPSFVNWTVTLPMDPQVLPDTDLRLSLSQHWLSLRFITQSPRSHHLVSRYRQGLLEQLERLPNLPHGIDIEIT